MCTVIANRYNKSVLTPYLKHTTILLHYNIIITLLHYYTACTLPYYCTNSLPHYLTYLTTTFSTSPVLTTALAHYLTTTLPYYLTTLLIHYLNTAVCHSQITVHVPPHYHTIIVHFTITHMLNSYTYYVSFCIYVQ